MKLKVSNSVYLHGIITIYSGDGHTYMEYLKHKNGKVYPPVPFSLEEMKQISKSAQEEFELIKLSKDFDRQILSFDLSTKYPSIKWAVKSMRRKLYFDIKPFERSFTIEFPPLLFTLKGNDNLSIFVINKFPVTENTKRYILPLPNMYNDGDICLGSTSFDTTSKNINVLIKEVENGFFRSEFVHFSGVKIRLKIPVEQYLYDISMNRRKMQYKDLIQIK